LLALAAGAVRANAPEAFVFTGVQENIPNHFLGWAKHQDVLEAILQNKEQYQIRYQKSVKITQQFKLFNLFKDPDLVPANIVQSHEVARYIGDTRYSQSGENVAEQILMDQLALIYGYDNAGSLEDPPDKLTLGRLDDLFGHSLYRQFIDLNSPHEKQVQSLIESNVPYLALLRQGVFDSILKREDGERLILKTLLDQSLS
jgi:hypothetical protein